MRVFMAANSSVPVVVRAISPGERAFTKWEKLGNIPIGTKHIGREMPGFTKGSWDPDSGVLMAIHIVIEPSDDLGAGYWALDINDEKIAQPKDVIFAHEMGHMATILDGTYTLGTPEEQYEPYGINAENDYRSRRGLPERFGHLGGTNFRKAGGGASGCFIATAAYGSDLEGPVQELRLLRDSVIMKTRAGAEFFEAFYAKYYSFSPAIGAMMAADPEAKALLGWGLVHPMVGYLRHARDFPRAATDDVPEPWRSYLEAMREDFAAWTAQIPLPQDFAGLEFDAAVAELRVAMGALLWNSRDREAYISQLEDSGVLPLRGSWEQRSEAATRCAGEGWDGATVSAIFGADAVVQGVVR
jgi:hypothetical protein